MSQAAEMRVKEQFAKDTVEHELTVLHDDGVYRHLRFQKAGSWVPYGFDIVTWPGYLYIGGDVEDFVFARTHDMFEFFGSDAADAHGINPRYWAQKLQGAEPRRSGGRRYTPECFQSRVLSWARGALREWDEETAEQQADGWLEDHPAVYPSLLIGALERELLDVDLFHSLPADQAEAHELLADHSWLFGDLTWEWDLTEFDPWFLWACWAIVWGIEQYRARPDADEPAAVTDRAIELGRLQPPYGGVERCAASICKAPRLSEDLGAYMYKDLESGKLCIFCGDCARYVELNRPERFKLVAL